MTDIQNPHPAPSPQSTPAPRPRRRGSAVALVAGGVLAGGILAGTLSATAQTDSGTGSGTDSGNGSAAVDESRSRHHGETLLEGDTATKVEAAVVAAYPGATIQRLETDADGTYEAHITDADGQHVIVAVDESFAVTGSVTAPEMGPRGGHGPRSGMGADGGGSTDDATAQTSGFAVQA